jgi:hypothetical protein
MSRRCDFVPGARKPGHPSGVGVNRIELVFRQRPIAQSELYRNIVKTAGCETAIEMPQSRHKRARGVSVFKKGTCRAQVDGRAALTSEGPIKWKLIARELEPPPQSCALRGPATGGKRTENLNLSGYP